MLGHQSRDRCLRNDEWDWGGRELSGRLGVEWAVTKESPPNLDTKSKAF